MLNARVYHRNGNWHHTLDNPAMPRHYNSRLGAAKALHHAACILLVQASSEISEAEANPDPLDLTSGCAPVVQHDTKYSADYPIS